MGLSRRIEDLHPTLQRMYEKLEAACQRLRIDIIPTSTLRTEAEQLALYAQGRKNLKTVNYIRATAGLGPITRKRNRIVTHALSSIHQFGLAFDICIIKGGLAVWDVKADTNKNNKTDYEEVGELGEALGLTWGGRFTHPDLVHFEYTGGLSLDELKEGKRPV